MAKERKKIYEEDKKLACSHTILKKELYTIGIVKNKDEFHIWSNKFFASDMHDIPYNINIE